MAKRTNPAGDQWGEYLPDPKDPSVPPDTNMGEEFSGVLDPEPPVDADAAPEVSEPAPGDVADLPDVLPLPDSDGTDAMSAGVTDDKNLADGTDVTPVPTPVESPPTTDENISDLPGVMPLDGASDSVNPDEGVPDLFDSPPPPFDAPEVEAQASGSEPFKNIGLPSLAGPPSGEGDTDDVLGQILKELQAIHQSLDNLRLG